MSVYPINNVDINTLLSNLRAFLVTNGIGRVPSVAGPLPPIWIEPRKGVPYPGQTEDLAPVEVGPTAVLSLEYSTEIPSAPFEGFLSRPHATIFIRTKTAPPGKDIYKQIKDLLHDQRNYSLNGLLVNESMLYRGLQPLGADSMGFMWNCEYEFVMWS